MFAPTAWAASASVSDNRNTTHHYFLGQYRCSWFLATRAIVVGPSSHLPAMRGLVRRRTTACLAGYRNVTPSAHIIASLSLQRKPNPQTVTPTQRAVAKNSSHPSISSRIETRCRSALRCRFAGSIVSSSVAPGPAGQRGRLERSKPSTEEFLPLCPASHRPRLLDNLPSSAAPSFSSPLTDLQSCDQNKPYISPTLVGFGRAYPSSSPQE
jgi:hypothetical protein